MTLDDVLDAPPSVDGRSAVVASDTPDGSVGGGFAFGPWGGLRRKRPVPPGTSRRDARFYDAVSKPTIRNVLRRYDAVPFLPNGECGIAPTATCGEVWKAYDAKWVPLDDADDFRLRYRLGRILGFDMANDEEWVLQRYVEVFGAEGLNVQSVIRNFGRQGAKELLVRLRTLADAEGVRVPLVSRAAGKRRPPRPSFQKPRPMPEGIAGHDARFYDAVSPRSSETLRRLGVVSFENGVPTVGPDETCLDVWNAWEKSEPPIDGLPDLEKRRRIRHVLNMSRYPQSERALLRYYAIVGRRGVTKYAVEKAFGSHCVEDAYARLQKIVGSTRKATQSRIVGEPEDVIAVLPAEVRDRFRAHLARQRVPAIPPIEGTHASRVSRLPDGPIRLLGALALIDGTANRRALSTRSDLLKHAERWGGLFSGVNVGNSISSLRAMRDYYETGRGTRDTELTRLLACDGWFRLVRNSIDCARLVLGDDAHMVIDRLPALREPGWLFAGELKEAREKMLGKKPAERTPVVTDVIARLMTVQAAVENRVHQLESLLARCMEALPKAGALLDAGLRAGFEWTGPIIRADGTLGAGQQTISFTFKRESTLLLEAHRRDPEDQQIRRLLPRRPEEPTRFDGLRHVKATWDRIHVVYDGTICSEPGAEPIEPFFIEFFRWSLFDSDRLSSDLVRGRKLEILTRLDLPFRLKIPTGFLTHCKATRPFARMCRGADPLSGDTDIVVPLVPLYHAMAYARVILRYGIRWGARLGEIMQIRVGCQRKHKLRGVWKPYFELQPKGWNVMGKFGIDVGTAKALGQIRAFTCARWHGWRPGAQGRPGLPIVRFGDRSRRDIKDAAFFFQGREGALSQGNLTLFTRLLLADIIDMRSHDGRYVFATALGLDGVGYEGLGALLHHSPASAMPKRYDLSALQRSEEAAERFNESIDAGVLGIVADG